MYVYYNVEAKTSLLYNNMYIINGILTRISPFLTNIAPPAIKKLQLAILINIALIVQPVLTFWHSYSWGCFNMCAWVLCLYIDAHIWVFPVSLPSRCGVRGRVCVRSWWIQRFFTCADGRLLRPDDGPLDEREQHARPPLDTRGRGAQRTPVRRGGLRRQHRYSCVTGTWKHFLECRNQWESLS